MNEHGENELQRNVDSEALNQENEEEPPKGNPKSVTYRKKKSLFWGAGILIGLLIVGSTFIGINYQKTNNFVNSISSQDAKLLNREINANSIDLKLSYNDFIAETNTIMNERNKLINKVVNYKAILFKSKINTLKYNLLEENQQTKASQLEHLKKELARIEKKDNIAMGDFINIVLTDNNLTWKESFDKLNKNISDRDTTINYIKNMEMLSYAPQISDYITLLNLENKFIRSYSQLLHATFNLSVDADLYDPYFFDNSSEIKDDKKIIVEDFSKFQKDYKELLAKDKAFWQEVNGLMPSRSLEKALTEFYNKTHDTLKPILT